MCQPRKWLWGLLPLAALWAVSVYVLTPQVESELVHRATVALHGDQTWAKPAIEGRDLVLEGEAPSEAARRAAREKIEQADGIRVIVDATTALPEAKPFAWTASRTSGTVTLSGAVAPGNAREQVIAATRRELPGLAVVDQMKAASGAPEASLAMTATALKTLAALKSGSVALVDNRLSVKGETADAAASGAVLAATRKLGAPIEVATIDLTPPPAVAAPAAATPPVPKAPPVERPYVWLGTREGAVLTLTGAVPSDSARTQVVAAAKSAMGSGKVVDQLKLASGLPQGIDYGAATSFALSQLASIRNGSVRLVDGKLELEGEAADAASYRKITTATSAPLPGGIRLESSAVQPPRVAAYTWSAKRDGKTFTLTGYYPDDGTRYMMKQALSQRFADLKVTDRTSIASGAPAGFSAAMGMALDQLSLLDSGEASIANGRLLISGVAADDKTAGAIKEALTKLVGGMPAEAKLTVPPPPAPPPAPAAAPAPPPPPVVAAAPPTAAPAAVPPSVPSAPQAAATTTTVPAAPPKPAEAAPQPKVVAATPPVAAVTPAPATPAAPPPPKKSEPAAPPASPAATAPPATPVPAAPAKPAEAAPQPKVAAATPPAAAATPAPATSAPVTPAAPPPPKKSEPAAPPASSAGTAPPAKSAEAAAPSPPSAPATAARTAAPCPADAGGKIKAGRIRFASSSAVLLATSRKRLARVAALLTRCPAIKIQVDGHTDSTGRAAYNDALSKRRAEVVRAALVKRGVDGARIAAVGHGSAIPLGDNRKVSGRALNRRIEFTVVQ